MLNNQKTKVLFAEADSDFVDVLISFLTLPLGTIVKILKKHYGDDRETAVKIGSITSLYNGLANLEKVHFWTEGCKEVLLNPTSSFVAEYRKLKLDISNSQPTEYLTCKTPNCSGKSSKIACLSVYYDTTACICGKTMTREIGKEEPQTADGGVFTVNKASLVISDDLRILPNTKGFTEVLSNLGITDMDVGQPTIVTFGFSEIMDLLKRSLLSRSPLTDIILNRKQMDSTTIEYEPGILFHETMKAAASSNSSKMNLKVILQKSTNKVLFAQADEDFIDLLASLLAIPLGGVERLLGSKTCLKSIHSLYTSIADPYLVNPNIKRRLMSPTMPHGYISRNPILPLAEESFLSTWYLNSTYTVCLSSAKFVKGQGKYVKGSRMYKITDDLTVAPFCMTTTLSDLKGLKIPMSDINELKLEIGLEEALSILKASLTSTCALTDGMIINPMLRKQPKQERLF